MKIHFQNSALGSDAFADFISANTKSSTVPLFVYVGGSNSKAMYADSKRREPKVIDQINATRECIGNDFAALILPCHYSLRLGREAGYTSFSTHFFCEVLPKLTIQPSQYAFLGFSSGAHLSLLLARATGGTRAFVSIGGVGMTEAFEMSIGAPGLKCPIRIYAGTEDPCLPHSERFAELLTKVGHNCDFIRRPGDHVFKDYEDNGSIADAIDFAARLL